VLVLKTLSWTPSHGYGIARWIRESSGEAFRVLDGALYTALHRLEERGAVESEWGHTEQGKRAKFYRLTPAGRRELRAATAQWERYAAGMSGVLTAVPRPI
jgi:PadR family transcriptional regulator, regulatory protein PadR